MHPRLLVEIASDNDQRMNATTGGIIVEQREPLLAQGRTKLIPISLVGACEAVERPRPVILPRTTNYLEQEQRNRSLGLAGELFVIEFERARLFAVQKPSLAERVEHTSLVVVTGV